MPKAFCDIFQNLKWKYVICALALNEIQHIEGKLRAADWIPATVHLLRVRSKSKKSFCMWTSVVEEPGGFMK